MTYLNTDPAGEGDPRPRPRDDAPSVDSGGGLRPTVAGARTGASPLWIAGGAAVLGGVVFLWLNGQRAKGSHEAETSAASAVTAAPIAAPPPAPSEVVAMEAAGRGLATSPAAPPPPVRVTPLTGPPMFATAPPVIPAPPARSPVLVVDLADGGPSATASAATAAAPGTAAAKGAQTAPGAAGSGGLNGDEQFAARIEGSQPARSSATVLRGRSLVVAQGAMIPGVLETALNSDLPGFARAVVSRDVRSFDGSQVLIPRGSRVIGEYRSAVAQGQSRAFVIWSRVLRPDGVSIQIGSPATDPLGRAGLSGSVDRHFLETFGGAILLSVISAGAASIAGTPSTEVVIGTPQAATGLASTASAYLPTVIPPTIKVPQGTPIRIFVARDLDFSPVRGLEP